MPLTFERPPLLGLLDLATKRDRELLASASLTSVALAIRAWKERTAQAATSAVKVLEVRLIGPNATILAVFLVPRRTTQCDGPGALGSALRKLQKYQAESSEQQQSSDAAARPSGYRKRPPRAHPLLKSHSSGRLGVVRSLCRKHNGSRNPSRNEASAKRPETYASNGGAAAMRPSPYIYERG